MRFFLLSRKVFDFAAIAATLPAGAARSSFNNLRGSFNTLESKYVRARAAPARGSPSTAGRTPTSVAGGRPAPALLKNRAEAKNGRTRPPARPPTRLRANANPACCAPLGRPVRLWDAPTGQEGRCAPLRSTFVPAPVRELEHTSGCRTERGLATRAGVVACGCGSLGTELQHSARSTARLPGTAVPCRLAKSAVLTRRRWNSVCRLRAGSPPPRQSRPRSTLQGTARRSSPVSPARSPPCRPK